MSRELGKDHRRESRRRGLSPSQEQLPALMYTRRSSPESQYSVNHDDNVEGITLQARLANKGRKRAEILKEIERLGLTEEITLPPLGIATPATSLPPTSKEEPPASLHADIVGDAQGGRRKLRKKRGLPSLLEPKPEEPSKKEFLNSPPNQSLGSKARGAFQKFRGTLSPPSRPSIRARTYPAVVDTQKKIELAREARRNLVEPSKYYEASPRSFGLKSTSSKETSTPADLERKIELARKLPRAKAPGDFLDTTSNALSRSFERDELSHPEIDMRFDTQNKVELAREAQWNLAYGTLPDEYSVNEILWGEIDSFTERGIKSASGEDHEFDTIICATGFNMSFSPRFPIIGENGVDLQKKWDKNPECYLSVTAANMPNYFMYLGPGSPLGHGSVVSSLERFCGSKTTHTSCVSKASSCMARKDRLEFELCFHVQNGDPNGPLISLHPGSRLHFFELLKNPRFEDFEWLSLCDDPDLTFAWMANGFTADEENKENTKDLTWFLPPVERVKFIKPPMQNGIHIHSEKIEEEKVVVTEIRST